MMMMRIPLQHVIRFSRTISTYAAEANQTLQHRLASALHRNAQIIPVLEQWRQEGNQVNLSHVRAIINTLRDSDNSLQALKVSEWMSEDKKCNLMPEDYAARLNLIENVLGLEEAEKFFENIPETARDDSVYTTLLMSYTKSDKTMCKAESTFRKMKELGLLVEPSTYNAMMSLYVTFKDRDKVEKLLHEMKDKNVKVDNVAANNVLKLYSAVFDVDAMERFMNERDVIRITLEWITALEMAKAYLGKGLREKAIKMLRLTEELLHPKSLKSAEELLMKLYAEAGEKQEVLRIWNLYKQTDQCDNEGYRSVIGSLLKLDDINKAEEIYKEWEECLSFLEFDIEIPTMLAYGYQERGMIEKAEKLMNNTTIKNRRMNEPITPLLEEWGKQMKPSDLKCLIKNLRHFNQFSKALQVSQWMDGKRVSNLYSEDYAARLHIIDNVLGLEEVEKFFETSIPENMKDYSVYATLLASYARSSKDLYKAEATFKKMRELGFLLKPSPFNSMISLYSTQKNTNRVEEILREMEENNVKPDYPTVNNVVRAYADESKIEKMEKFMSREYGIIKLERDTLISMAKAYHNSDLIKKAIEMYGDVSGSEGEVYRIWQDYKKKEEAKVEECGFLIYQKKKVKDDVYRTLITTLLKLKDVQGAEDIYYEEWKPNGPKMDLKIPGLLISRFCEEGNEEKVKEFVKSIRVKRIEMRLRMLKNSTFNAIKRVGMIVFITTVVFFDACGRSPFFFSSLFSF